MDELERLRNLMKDRPFLVADGVADQVRLVSEPEAMSSMNEAGLFQSQLVMKAGLALENFVRLVGKPDRTFSLKDIATMTATPYNRAYNWVTEGVIIPSVRARKGAGKGKEPIFSWTDGFIAGVCGSLRRNGVRLKLLRQVTPLFIDSKKQTAQPLVAAKRS